MFGYSGYTATYSPVAAFSYFCGALVLSYATSVTQVNYYVTNFRVRVCDFGTPYYDEVTAKCY